MTVKEPNPYWSNVKLGERDVPGRTRTRNRKGTSGTTRRDLSDAHTFMAKKDFFEKETNSLKYIASDKGEGYGKNQYVVKPAYVRLEDRFINEMYGTEAVYERGRLVRAGTTGAIEAGTATSLWGLDLKRVMKNDDGSEINVGDANYYETMTRGKVDWAFYHSDPAYQKAKKEFLAAGKTGIEGKIDTPEEVRALHQFDKRTYQGILDKAQGVRKKWEWDDWKDEYDVDKVTMKGDDLFIDGEKHIGMDKRLDIKYELDDDGKLKGKEFAVGKNEDGTTKYKTIDSPYLNVGKLYDPASYKGKAHEWKGIEVEALHKDLPDIDSKPSLGGYVEWNKGKPSLANPVKADTAPVINPVKVT